MTDEGNYKSNDRFVCYTITGQCAVLFLQNLYSYLVHLKHLHIICNLANSLKLSTDIFTRYSSLLLKRNNCKNLTSKSRALKKFLILKQLPFAAFTAKAGYNNHIVHILNLNLKQSTNALNR